MKRFELAMALAIIVLVTGTFVLTATVRASTSAYTFNTIDDPNGVGATSVTNINNNGDIVGFYTDSKGTSHGFLYAAAAHTRR